MSHLRINSFAFVFCRFSGETSPYLALNSSTGALSLTSDLAAITEDTDVIMTVMAEDHGVPPLSATGNYGNHRSSGSSAALRTF